MKKWYYKLILEYAKNNLVSNDIINSYFEELSKANDKRSKDNIKMKIIQCCDNLIKWCIYSIFNDDDRYMEEDLYMYGVESILKVINKYDYRKVHLL